MADALIVELHVAESLKAIRTMQPLRTRWAAAQPTALLEMLPLPQDGILRLLDEVERRKQD
jgi:hypothetical protein